MAVTTLDPRTALVVIDLQNGIVGNPGLAPYSAAEVVERTGLLADAFHEHGLPVVLVRVTAAADGADAVPGRTDGPNRAHTWPEGWDVLVDELAGHPGDIVVTKRNWGAFHGTDLDLQLRRRGVTQIVLTGIATSGVVLSDGCLDADPEVHRVLTQKVFPRQADVRLIADWNPE